MKLKCVKHSRRVHVLAHGKTIHRSDGSHCPSLSSEEGANSPLLIIGKEIVTPYRVWLMQRNKVKRWRTNHSRGAF